MSLAYPFQRFQDWSTQQWVILSGRTFDPHNQKWLKGPYGGLHGIGEEFFEELATNEHLLLMRNDPSSGLLTSIDELNLTEDELKLISDEVIEFYERTAQFKFAFKIHWNFGFKIFGGLVNVLFSRRIRQLYLPTKKVRGYQSLKSEIITLLDKDTKLKKHTIWYRTMESTGQAIFSGVYGTCTLPSGKKCVRAVFPLPNGNATVILEPIVLDDGSLRLVSSGKKFGDPGFYFLLKDSKGHHHAKYIRSFRDTLTISSKGTSISAEQHLTLWKRQVLCMNYSIDRK